MINLSILSKSSLTVQTGSLTKKGLKPRKAAEQRAKDAVQTGSLTKKGLKLEDFRESNIEYIPKFKPAP